MEWTGLGRHGEALVAQDSRCDPTARVDDERRRRRADSATLEEVVNQVDVEHRLTARIIEAVGRFQILSTEQIRGMAAPDRSLRRVQAALEQLAAQGLVQLISIRHPGGRTWRLTSKGAVAAGARALDPALAAGRFMGDCLARAEVALAWMRAARERGHEAGVRSFEHRKELPGGSVPPVCIAESELSYLLIDPARGARPYRRWIEIDRTTDPLLPASERLARYAAVPRAAAQEPALLKTVRYRTWPQLVVVMVGPEKERQLRLGHLLALLSNDADQAESPIALRFVAFEELVQAGPFASIFTRLEEPNGEQVDWLAAKPPIQRRSVPAAELEVARA